MIGSKQLVIDASEFLKGMSVNEELADVGFSPSTEGVNLTKTPGVIYAPAIQVDGDSDVILDDEIIASCPDHAAASPSDRLVVTADGDFMRFNGTKLLDVTGGQDTTQTYAKGFTDIVNFAAETYATSKEYLARWSGTQTFNFQFAANTNAALPHPLVVFENNLYSADGNLLKRMTGAAAAPATILTLATNEFIQALGIDPTSGKILVSVVYGQNISGLISRTNKVLWYDGFSNKVIKSIVVEDMVTAFHNHSGNVVVGYGTSLGILTGSGIRFLRKLNNVSLLSTELPYKHNFASIGNTMYVVDKTKVLAYGPVFGNNIFYYAMTNKVNSNAIDCIFNAGSGKLGFSTATSKFYTMDTTSVATLNKLNFYTNFYSFPRPILIRRVYLEYIDLVASTANIALTVQWEDRSNPFSLSTEDGTLTNVRFVDYIGVTDDKKIRSLQVTVSNTTENDGLKRIIVYYDFVE